MCFQVMLYGLAVVLGMAANTACLPITLKITTIITMEFIIVSTGVMYCQAEWVKKVTIPSVTGVFCRGLCSSVFAVLASSKIFLVRGPKSIVTSFGRWCSGDSAFMILSVCKCGICMGFSCSEDGVMFVCIVDNASIMGMLAACIMKCVEVV